MQQVISNFQYKYALQNSKPISVEQDYDLMSRHNTQDYSKVISTIVYNEHCKDEPYNIIRRYGDIMGFAYANVNDQLSNELKSIWESIPDSKINTQEDIQELLDGILNINFPFIE